MRQTEPFTLQFAIGDPLAITFYPRWFSGIADRIRGQLHRVRITTHENPAEAAGEACNFLLTYGHPRVSPPRLLSGAAHLKLGLEPFVPVSAPDCHGEPRFGWLGADHRPPRMVGYQSQGFFGSVQEYLLDTRHEYGLVTPDHVVSACGCVKSLVIRGCGMGWLPASLAVNELRSGELVLAGPEECSTHLEIRMYRGAGADCPEAGELWRALCRQYPTSFDAPVEAPRARLLTFRPAI